MSSKHEKFATLAADRLNPQVVGLSSSLIGTILAALLPILLGKLTECLPAPQRKQPTPEQLRAKLQAAYDKNPKAVREMAAKEAVKRARKDGTKINKAQSLQIADAAIQEGLQTPATDWSVF